jgi:two-component system, OmpR family, sensor kinase
VTHFPAPRRRTWFRSLYWRIAAGFVVFLAGTLAAQVGLFVWLITRGEGDVSSKALETFATLVANDVASEIAAKREPNLNHHLTERYGSLPRVIWVIFRDGHTVTGRSGPVPPGLVRMMVGRLRGTAGPHGPETGFGTGGMPPPMAPLPDSGFAPGGPGETGRSGLTPDGRALQGPPPGPPTDGPDRPFEPRRRPAFAPVMVAGTPVAMVVIEAGRPAGRLWEEMGPFLLLGAGGLIVGAGALAAVLIFRPAHLRLEGLIDAARRLGGGDNDVRASESGGDEISGVAHAFNQMADGLADRAAQLQASDAARRQLLADVSHELMTPLTAIRGYLETLTMADLRLSDAERQRYLGIVSEETSRLERLIGDLLDLSRLEAGGGTLNIEPIGIEELFNRVLDRHGRAAQDKKVALAVTARPGLILSVDRMRFEQAVQNLAANALRHTPAGGRIELGAEQTIAGTTVRVSDSGEGIAPGHLSHVFDRFYKVDASRTEMAGSGSGLGLSIVKAIVERHGGRIAVHSRSGQGTTFEIFLPANP